MRAIEWEAKGVSRTLNPSTAATQPFPKVDEPLTLELGRPLDGTVKSRMNDSGPLAELMPPVAPR